MLWLCLVMCIQNLDLGVRTDGVRVSDVELPPWATGMGVGGWGCGYV